MFPRARFALALALMSLDVHGVGAAAPIHRTTFDAPAQNSRGERPVLAHPAPATPHRPEAEHTPAPLWNPLKRKRMAMPPPPATGVDYAF